MAQHSEVTVGLQQLEGEEETAQSLDLRQASGRYVGQVAALYIRTTLVSSLG